MHCPAACSCRRTQGTAAGVPTWAQSQWHAGRSRAQLPSTHLTPCRVKVFSFLSTHYIALALICWVLPMCQPQLSSLHMVSHSPQKPYDCLRMKKLKRGGTQGRSCAPDRLVGRQSVLLTPGTVLSRGLPFIPSLSPLHLLLQRPHELDHLLAPFTDQDTEAQRG